MEQSTENKYEYDSDRTYTCETDLRMDIIKKRTEEGWEQTITLQDKIVHVIGWKRLIKTEIKHLKCKIGDFNLLLIEVPENSSGFIINNDNLFFTDHTFTDHTSEKKAIVLPSFKRTVFIGTYKDKKFISHIYEKKDTDVINNSLIPITKAQWTRQKNIYGKEKMNFDTFTSSKMHGSDVHYAEYLAKWTEEDRKVMPSNIAVILILEE